MDFLKKIAEVLERLLEKPPYWIFLFISTFFVIVSLISQNHFKEIWAFFLYSVVGTLWRHAEKDISGSVKNPQNRYFELTRRSIYHIGNLALLIVLFLYLGYL
jgi:hypothetical protein